MKEGDQLIQKLKQQAELTIKLKAWWMLMAHTVFYGEGKKAGIREVVELIKQYPIIGVGFQSALEAKLKEWGIEDENEVSTKP